MPPTTSIVTVVRAYEGAVGNDVDGAIVVNVKSVQDDFADLLSGLPGGLSSLRLVNHDM